MRNFIFCVILVFQTSIILAQEISAIVVDQISGEPVPFATIQYAPNKGGITNDEGKFSLPAGAGELVISSLGYTTLTVPVQDLTGTILLAPASIELGNVFLTNKNLSGKEIIQKVMENVPANYNHDLTHKKFFFRESHVNSIRQFDLNVKKSTFPGLDQGLMSDIAQKVPKYSDSYKEVFGDLYGDYQKQKLHVIKAANLHNPQSTAGLTELTDKLEGIFKDNIKSNSYIKLRTGIIGVKLDAEEFEFGEKEGEMTEKATPKTEAQLEKEVAEKQKNLRTRTHSKIKGLLKTTFWNEGITLDVFENSGKYKFQVEGYTQMDNSIVYIISFEPRRRADFKGKMYVNTVDYGVHRLDYENVKNIKSFRLLGISTANDIYRGKMIFSRSPETGKYDPRYLALEKGESFGIKRPFSIIEKNKYVKGRRKQNELALAVNIQSGDITKHELVVYENQALEETDFVNMESINDFEYHTFKLYDPTFWAGYNIIEPNAAIKAFTALEKESSYY